MRLFGDTRNGHGAVQIFTITLRWQGICPDNSWTDSDAATICQHLGYAGGFVATPIDAVRGPDSDSVPLSRNLYDAKCPGTSADEITTELCTFRVESSVTRCAAPEGRLAALQCSKSLCIMIMIFISSERRSSNEVVTLIASNSAVDLVCEGHQRAQGRGGVADLHHQLLGECAKVDKRMSSWPPYYSTIMGTLLLYVPYTIMVIILVYHVLI